VAEDVWVWFVFVLSVNVAVFVIVVLSPQVNVWVELWPDPLALTVWLKPVEFGSAIVAWLSTRVVGVAENVTAA
jgi:hypothetical protein